LYARERMFPAEFGVGVMCKDALQDSLLNSTGVFGGFFERRQMTEYGPAHDLANDFEKKSRYHRFVTRFGLQDTRAGAGSNRKKFHHSVVVFILLGVGR